MRQRWLSICRRFERTYGIHSQIFRVYEELDHESMKMKATFPFETPGTNYPTKRRKTKNFLILYDKVNLVARKAFCLDVDRSVTEHSVVSIFFGAKL
jgi:hypothetical protein